MRKITIKKDGTIVKGKAAQIGEVRVWSDGKKHKKTSTGWVIVGEKLKEVKSRDEDAYIHSSKMLDNNYLNDEQIGFRNKLFKLGFDKFDYHKLKNQFDDIFSSDEADLTLKVEHDNTLSFNYEHDNGTKIKRTFKIVNNKIESDLDLFKLPKDLQGKGYAKKITRDFYKQLKNSNVSKVNLVANDTVGGYAWANYGFNITKKNLEKLVNNDPELDVDWVKNIISKFYDINSDSTSFPMRLISMYHEDGKHIGKEILLGSSWEGVLDFSDKKQVSIFESYLSEVDVDDESIKKSFSVLPELIQSIQIYKNKVDNSISDKYRSFYKDIINKGYTEESFFNGLIEKDVSVFNIFPMKNDLEKSKIVHHIGDDSVPCLLKIDRKYYVVDGRNKIASKIIKGQINIKCKVYEQEK